MRTAVMAMAAAWAIAACSAPPETFPVHGARPSSEGATGATSGADGTASQGDTTGRTHGPSAPSQPFDAGASSGEGNGNGAGGGAGNGSGGGTTTSDAGAKPTPPPSNTGCACGCTDPCLGALIDLCAKVPDAPGCDQVPDVCACLADCSNGPLSCLSQLNGP